MAKKQKYNVGDWFAVPLRNGGYGLGIVARSAKGGRILLGYFFGPRRDDMPTLDDMSSIRAGQAVGIFRFGDLGLVDGDWPVIGSATNWVPADWPMPVFYRKPVLTEKMLVVKYADDDPSNILSEVILPSGDEHSAKHSYYQDGLLGAGAVEIELTKLLG